MTLNPSTMRLGIASILVGLVGAYGVRHMMEEEEAPAEEKKVVERMVPIATGNLPANRVIRKGDVGFVPMTEARINERGWNQNELMMAAEQIIGRQLRVRVAAGSPFLTSEIYLEDEGPGYPPAQGMRAVQVRITQDRGGHNAKPGDFVDLLFTSEPQDASRGKPAIPEKTIKVAEGVQVLHIDHPKLSEIHWAVGYKEKAPVFTLEVEPSIAGQVTTLKNYGEFAVVVRANDDPVGRSKTADEYSVLDLLGIEEPPEPQQPQFVSVEYWHGGKRSYKHFPMGSPAAPPQDQLAQQPLAPAQPVADVLPNVPMPAPTPAAQPDRRPQTPSIPYRPNPSPSVHPPTPSAPSVDSPAPPSFTSGSTDPFKDDPQPASGAGEVLP